jgi:carbon monoxide dehydrogenase subunit G
MKLENEFTVSASMEEAWKGMLDLEKVTPCLPGAALTEQVGDEYNGTVKVEEADESAHRAVIQADGKDARGQGTASATITSTLHEENGGVRVHVETDMQLTGKVAQFGRGIHKEVATKIMDRFSDCLEKELF